MMHLEQQIKTIVYKFEYPYFPRHNFHSGPEIVMPCPVSIFVTIICLSEDCGRQKPHETNCNKQLIEAGLTDMNKHRNDSW